jgi:hypothetical protein
MDDQIRARYEALLPEDKRRVDSLIRFLSRRAVLLTGADGSIGEDPFIGIWRDRADVQDSSGWVRRLRETEWSG